MAANSLFTLADIADQVCHTLGATDDISQALAKKLVNRALIFFSEAGEWSWQRVYEQTFNTVGGTSVVELTAIKVTAMYLTNPKRKLKLMEERQFRRIYPDATAQGSPFIYRKAGPSTTVVDARKFALYPTPDAVYPVKWDGVKAIALLAADADDVRLVTGMPSKHVNLLIDLACAIGFGQEDDSDENTKLQEVLTRLAAAYSDDNSEIEDVFVMAPMEQDDIDRYYDPQLDPRFGE